VSVVTTILGQVERLTFENEETGFRVVRLGKVSGLEAKSRTVLVGVMPAIGVGTMVRVSGRLEDDPRHGERFKVESLVVLEPDTIEGLEKYLSSGAISGVGPVYAKRIVQYFGLGTLAVLDNEPHRLAEVPGLGKGRVEKIRTSWVEHSQMSNVLLALSSHGASPALAARIVEAFGAKSAEVLQNNPYRLAIVIPGVGFKTADRLAQAGGIPAEHPERAQAGLLHVMRSSADGGHCVLPRVTLVARAAEMLGVADALLESALDTLWADELLYVEEDLVSLPKLRQAELIVAERVQSLLAAPTSVVSGIAEKIRAFEAAQDLSLAETQVNAIRAAAEQKFLVITGGPGVGKTTLVRAILAVFSGQKLRVRLAAPTGRAAKRLSESTAQRATTLHRLLEVQGRGGTFARNAEHPIEVDLLIVDEASMIDVQLAASLLRATPNAARVVMVGDADQLPSVGPGAVLQDLIQSGTVPVVRLETIFRQTGQSGIVLNSHRILAGEEPKGSDSPGGDFFIVPCKSPERAAELIGELVETRIPQRFGLDAKNDVQVLTPMHRGAAGTLALNQMLQTRLNSQGESLSEQGGAFRVGDKVMQLSNDYDKEVFNGDVGEVFQIQREPLAVVVRFDAEEGARLVSYGPGDLGSLSLAYATSIHKSQGSEYSAVVIPLLSAHFVMLSRNLLYTAVTRAKKLCVLVADPRALSIALGETRRELRQTRLQERLKSLMKS
jgi:exodeoxyribonuclease V alpha subunit